jgi:hypothetical protein
MKYIIILNILFLYSYSTSNTIFREYATEQDFKKVTDTKVEYNGACCPSMQSSCSNYTEWRHSNGKLTCTCNDTD